jgi:C2 domain
VLCGVWCVHVTSGVVSLPRSLACNVYPPLVCACAKKDANGFSDPYFLLKRVPHTEQEAAADNTLGRTPTVKKSLNPVYDLNESTFRVSDVCLDRQLDGSEPDRLEVTCWDWDKFSRDDFMGRVLLSFGAIPLPVREAREALLAFRKLLQGDQGASVPAANEHVSTSAFTAVQTIERSEHQQSDMGGDSDAAVAAQEESNAESDASALSDVEEANESSSTNRTTANAKKQKKKQKKQKKQKSVRRGEESTSKTRGSKRSQSKSKSVASKHKSKPDKHHKRSKSSAEPDDSASLTPAVAAAAVSRASLYGDLESVRAILNEIGASTYDEWYDLKPRDGKKDKVAGDVHLMFRIDTVGLMNELELRQATSSPATQQTTTPKRKSRHARKASGVCVCVCVCVWGGGGRGGLGV